MADKTDHDLLTEIHTTLLGKNGQGGLIRSHEALKKDYYKFKQHVLEVFFFLVGSGALGIGVWKILLGG